MRVRRAPVVRTASQPPRSVTPHKRTLPLLTCSAVVPGAAVRVMRTAAGWRALRVGLLLGGLFVLGLLYGGQARAAESTEAARAGESLSSAVAEVGASAGLDARGIPDGRGPDLSGEASDAHTTGVDDGSRSDLASGAVGTPHRIGTPFPSGTPSPSGTLTEVADETFDVARPEGRAGVAESVREGIAVAEEEAAARLAGPAPAPGLRLPESPVGLPLMPGGAAEPGLPGLGGLPGVPDPAALPAPDVQGVQEGPGGLVSGAHGVAVQGADLGPAEGRVTPERHGRGLEKVRGHRFRVGGPYVASYTLLNPPAPPHSPSPRTPARDADVPSWPLGRDGVPANGSTGDNGSSRHGDAQAVTLDQRAPLRLVAGAAVWAEVPGTRDRHRDIPVFPG